MEGCWRETNFKINRMVLFQVAGPMLQVLSGGQDGAVCVWEVQQQRLLARQSIAAAHVPICESANQTHGLLA